MPNIVSALSLRPGGELWEWKDGVQSRDTLVRNIPTFTCPHCNRVVFVTDSIDGIRSDFHYCHRCNARTCDSRGCVEECRSIAEEDTPLARSDHLGQPWLLRDAEGYPVDRIWVSETECKLIRRKDNGMTQREMAKQARPVILLPDWLARCRARERELEEQGELIHERDASGQWTRSVSR